MVEIEIGVLRGQCLDSRIDDPKRLRREITAWERRRNAARSGIKWMFTTDKARAKWAASIPPLPRSHHHCAEPLVCLTFNAQSDLMLIWQIGKLNACYRRAGERTHRDNDDTNDDGHWLPLVY
jgi:hypothetical protein